MRTIVTKDSLKPLTHKLRFPRTFKLFVAGCWLHDLLTANGYQPRLMEMSYWVSCRSLDSKRAVITYKGV
jgi:hypothetical protein